MLRYLYLTISLILLIVGVKCWIIDFILFEIIVNCSYVSTSTNQSASNRSNINFRMKILENAIFPRCRCEIKQSVNKNLSVDTLQIKMIRTNLKNDRIVAGICITRQILIIFCVTQSAPSQLA